MTDLSGAGLKGAEYDDSMSELTIRANKGPSTYLSQHQVAPSIFPPHYDTPWLLVSSIVCCWCLKRRKLWDN